jgi:glycosyltransferase involved in cell wall biosynthesis
MEQQQANSVASPRVSVVTTFLDGETVIAEAIESVIAQNFEHWELILVDDGSGSSATTIAKAYAARFPQKIRYLEHPGHINRGMSASRNLGIRHSRGEFIALLDADDVWLANNLAHHVAVMDTHPEVGLVCGTAIYWNSWSGGKDSTIPAGHRQDVPIHPPEATLSLYPFGTAQAPCPSAFVLRSGLVKQIRGFEEQFAGDNQLYEDQAFLSKVYLSAPVYFCSTPSIKYREHQASLSAKVRKAGKYHQVRLYFLEWFEEYLRTVGEVDPRVTLSLRRALRYYRNPRIHYLLSVPTMVRNRCRRLGAQTSRMFSR